jgi:RNA polymerase sigma-70 factor (ECF subfamily)
VGRPVRVLTGVEPRVRPDPDVGDPAEASDTDAALVRAVQLGDADAFETLVRRHLRSAHQAARSLLDDVDDADDIVQDSFIAALQKIDQCRNPARFRPWLIAIVRNRAHDLQRRSRRSSGDPKILEFIASDVPGPGRMAARAQLREDLHEAAARLTELQREVLMLHDYEGFQHREVAGQLGISEVSSRFNLHVARKAMRRHLSAEYGNEES